MHSIIRMCCKRSHNQVKIFIRDEILHSLLFCIFIGKAFISDYTYKRMWVKLM